MDTGILFNVFNGLATVAWLLLIFLPRFVLTRKVVMSGYGSFFFALLYIVCFVVAITEQGTPDFSSMEGITAIFSSDWGALTGWVHYLCFDLFTGCWMKSHADRHKIPHVWIVAPLFFTFMLGPIGWGMYFILLKTKKIPLFDPKINP